MEYSTEHGRLLGEAEAAWRAEDYGRAAELFRQAAALAPEDADAAFFADASAALAEGADYRRIAPLAEPAQRAIACAARRSGSGKAYFDACCRVVSAVVSVTSRHYEAVEAYRNREQKKRRRTPEAPVSADALLRDCVNLVTAAAKQTAGAALECAQDLSEADEFFWNALLTLLDNARTYRFAAELESDPEIGALMYEIEKLRGNVFGDYTGVEDLPEDEGEYVETVCPACGETLSFAPDELSGGPVECPFCGGRIDV